MQCIYINKYPNLVRHATIFSKIHEYFCDKASFPKGAHIAGKQSIRPSLLQETVLDEKEKPSAKNFALQSEVSFCKFVKRRIK